MVFPYEKRSLPGNPARSNTVLFQVSDLGFINFKALTVAGTVTDLPLLNSGLTVFPDGAKHRIT